MAKAAEELDPIWAAWRRIVKVMSVPSLAWEVFFSRSVWTQWGVDYVSGLRRNRSSHEVFGLVRALTPADARSLHALAAINHRRLEAVSRWTAVGAVTLPASAVLMVAQLSPESLKRVDFDAGDAVALAVAALGVAWILMAAWRARQIVTVIELALVERRLTPTGGESAEEEAPLQAPMGA